MGDCVAHHVHQRIAQRGQHVRVEAHLAAGRIERDALAQRLGGVTHGPRQRCKYRLSRDQAKSLRQVAHFDECPIHAL